MDMIPQDNTPRKQCIGECQRWLPATSEYFQAERYGNQKECLRNECKECRRNKSKARYYQPGNHEENLARAKAYRELPGMKERRSALNKEWREHSSTKELRRNYTREYRKRPGKMDEKHAFDAEYMSRPEVKRQRLEYERDYLKKPEKRERHRARDRVNQHTRRARKRVVAGKCTPEQIQGLLKQQKHACYYCSNKFERKGSKYIYHVEHTFPLSRVAETDIPANDISYLVLACPTCNKKKSDKFPWEWPEGGRLL